jgi:hypothetical protein
MIWEKKGKNQPKTNSSATQNYGWQGVPKQPGFLAVDADNKRKAAKDEQYRADEQRYRHRQNAIAICATGISGIALIFLIITAVVAYCALQASNEAVIVARKQTVEAQKQTAQAMRQTKAAEDQVATQSDTEERQLRAYVIVGSKFLSHFAENDILYVQGIFDNLGQTPVYDGVWLSGVGVRAYPAFEESALSYPTCKQIMEMPGTQKWYFGKIAYPDKYATERLKGDEIASVKGGASAVYFRGRFCYRDIFRKVRNTDFCIFWLWQDGKMDTAGGDYCRSSNNADNDNQ